MITLSILFAVHQLGKDQASLNVIRLEPTIPSEDGVLVVPRREHGQDVLYRQPSSSNHRLATENTRYNNDSIEKLTFRIYMCHCIEHSLSVL